MCKFNAGAKTSCLRRQVSLCFSLSHPPSTIWIYSAPLRVQSPRSTACCGPTLRNSTANQNGIKMFCPHPAREAAQSGQLLFLQLQRLEGGGATPKYHVPHSPTGPLGLITCFSRLKMRIAVILKSWPHYRITGEKSAVILKLRPHITHLPPGSITTRRHWLRRSYFTDARIPTLSTLTCWTTRRRYMTLVLTPPSHRILMTLDGSLNVSPQTICTPFFPTAVQSV